MATKTMKCLLRLSLFAPRNLPIRLVHRRSCSNKSDDSVRIVFISDTHSYHHQLPSLPHGDILIHAGMLDRIIYNIPFTFTCFLFSNFLLFPHQLPTSGDFTERRPPRAEEYKDFMDWYCAQPHKHKVLISGNRDNFMDTNTSKKVTTSFLLALHIHLWASACLSMTFNLVSGDSKYKSM